MTVFSPADVMIECEAAMRAANMRESDLRPAAGDYAQTACNPPVRAILVSHNGAKWIRDCPASLLSSPHTAKVLVSRVPQQ